MCNTKIAVADILAIKISLVSMLMRICKACFGAFDSGVFLTLNAPAPRPRIYMPIDTLCQSTGLRNLSLSTNTLPSNAKYVYQKSLLLECKQESKHFCSLWVWQKSSLLVANMPAQQQRNLQLLTQSKSYNPRVQSIHRLHFEVK